VRNDLDWEHQPRKPPDRTHEMLQIAKGPLGANAVPVVVDEGEDGERERNGWNTRRLVDARQQPHEVAEEDEEQQAGQNGKIPLVTMAHDLLGLAVDELVHDFGEMLRVGRFFDAEPEPDRDEEEDQSGEDDELERQRIADGIDRKSVV